jgi:hypothetical protein
MVNKRLRFVLCLAALGVGSSTAPAQIPGGGGASKRPIRLVVSGGLTLPAGDLKNTHDSGFHYDASLLLNFAGIPLTLRPEISLTRFNVKDLTSHATSGYGGSGDVTQMLGALGNIELPLAGGLYAIAGGGMLNLKTPATGTGAPDLSQSKVTFNAGAGLRFHLGGISGFVEGRMGTASYDAGKFAFSKATFIPISFGLAF